MIAFVALIPLVAFCSVGPFIHPFDPVRRSFGRLRRGRTGRAQPQAAVTGHFIVIIVRTRFPCPLVDRHGFQRFPVGGLLVDPAGHQDVLQKSVITRHIAEFGVDESGRVPENHLDHPGLDVPAVYVPQDQDTALFRRDQDTALALFVGEVADTGDVHKLLRK